MSTEMRERPRQAQDTPASGSDRPRTGAAMELARTAALVGIAAMLLVGAIGPGDDARLDIRRIANDTDAQRALVARQLETIRRQLATTHEILETQRVGVEHTRRAVRLADQTVELGNRTIDLLTELLDVSRRILDHVRELNRKTGDLPES